MENKYDESICRARHEGVDCKLNGHNWIFSIVITLQLACFGFMGWLSTKTIQIEVGQQIQDNRIGNIEKEINEKLSVILTNGDKLDIMLKKMGEK